MILLIDIFIAFSLLEKKKEKKCKINSGNTSPVNGPTSRSSPKMDIFSVLNLLFVILEQCLWGLLPPTPLLGFFKSGPLLKIDSILNSVMLQERQSW